MLKQKFLALLLITLSFGVEAGLIGVTEYYIDGSTFTPESTTLQEGETVRFHAQQRRGFYDVLRWEGRISIELENYIQKHGNGWWDLGRYEVILKKLDLAFWQCNNSPELNCEVGGNFTFSGGMSRQRLEPTYSSSDFHHHIFEDQNLFQSMAAYSAQGQGMYFDFEAVGDSYSISSVLPWVEAHYYWEVREYEVHEVIEPGSLPLLACALGLLLALRKLACSQQSRQLLSV
ncbi:hypothetical protein [Synechococcus phage Ssp-JY43]|nr:hypothetical protein [Synechococcus phage Yong-M4-251]